MNLSHTFAIFVRQWFLYRSNPTRLASIFMWIVIDITQWGFITKYLGSFGQATYGFITVILGAIILWGFMSRIQQGIMMAFLEDIWSQNFINYFASPLTVREYLSGLVLSSCVTSTGAFVVMVGMAGVAFGYDFFRMGIFILPFFLILFVFGMAMGIFISAVIFRLGPSAEWLGWPIPLVLSIFSGVYYPVSTLPENLRIIAHLLPPAYVFESMRSILITGSFSAHTLSDLATGAVLALVYLFIMYRFFTRIYRDNLRSGGLVKFSAEGA